LVSVFIMKIELENNDFSFFIGKGTKPLQAEDTKQIEHILSKLLPNAKANDNDFVKFISQIFLDNGAEKHLRKEIFDGFFQSLRKYSDSLQGTNRAADKENIRNFVKTILQILVPEIPDEIDDLKKKIMLFKICEYETEAYQALFETMSTTQILKYFEFDQNQSEVTFQLSRKMLNAKLFWLANNLSVLQPEELQMIMSFLFFELDTYWSNEALKSLSKLLEKRSIADLIDPKHPDLVDRLDKLLNMEDGRYVNKISDELANKAGFFDEVTVIELGRKAFDIYDYGDPARFLSQSNIWSFIKRNSALMNKISVENLTKKFKNDDTSLDDKAKIFWFIVQSRQLDLVNDAELNAFLSVAINFLKNYQRRSIAAAMVIGYVNSDLLLNILEMIGPDNLHVLANNDIKEKLLAAIPKCSISALRSIFDWAKRSKDETILYACLQSPRIAEVLTAYNVNTFLSDRKDHEYLVSKLGFPDLSNLKNFNFSIANNMQAAAQNAYIAGILYNDKVLEEHPELRIGNIGSSHLPNKQIIEDLKACFTYLEDKNIQIISLAAALPRLRELILDRLPFQTFINDNRERLIKDGSTDTELNDYFSDPNDELYLPAWRWLMSFQKATQEMQIADLLNIESMENIDFNDDADMAIHAIGDMLRYLLTLSEDPENKNSRDDILENIIQQCSICQREYAMPGALETAVSCHPGGLGRLVKALASHPHFRGEQYQEVHQQALNLLAAVGGDAMNKIFTQRDINKPINAAELKAEILRAAEAMTALTKNNAFIGMRNEPMPLTVNDNFTIDLLALRNEIIKNKYSTLDKFIADVEQHMKDKTFKANKKFMKLTEEDLYCIRMLYYGVDEHYKSAIMRRLDSLNDDITQLTKEEVMLKTINDSLNATNTKSSLETSKVDINKSRFVNSIRNFCAYQFVKERIDEKFHDPIADKLAAQYLDVYNNRLSKTPDIITIEKLKTDYTQTKKQVLENLALGPASLLPKSKFRY